jgi:FtsH-binding integral membrane protein
MTEEYDNELMEVTSFHHSNYYHKFFAGYSESMVPNKKGTRNKILRKYVGSYYSRECSDSAWILSKALYLLLGLMAAALFLYGISRPTETNRLWYVVIPSSASTISLILFLTKLADCILKKRKMTVYEYRTTFGSLFLWSMITSGLLAITAVTALISSVLTDSGESPLMKAAAVTACLFSSICIFMIGAAERRNSYSETPGEEEPYQNGVIIQ